MPREKVEILIDEFGSKNITLLVENLAETFQVSRQAMDIRTGD